MDKYDDVVIADLVKQVARLEAAIRAKDAALVMVQEEIWPLIDPSDDDYTATGEDWRAAGKRLGQLFKDGKLAALSPDAGKGGLPPEALRFIWIMREVARTIGGRDDPQMMSWYYAAQSELWRLLRAALDALKGVE